MRRRARQGRVRRGSVPRSDRRCAPEAEARRRERTDPRPRVMPGASEHVAEDFSRRAWRPRSRIVWFRSQTSRQAGLNRTPPPGCRQSARAPGSNAPAVCRQQGRLAGAADARDGDPGAGCRSSAGRGDQRAVATGQLWHLEHPEMRAQCGHRWPPSRWALARRRSRCPRRSGCARFSARAMRDFRRRSCACCEDQVLDHARLAARQPPARTADFLVLGRLGAGCGRRASRLWLPRAWLKRVLNALHAAAARTGRALVTRSRNSRSWLTISIGTVNSAVSQRLERVDVGEAEMVGRLVRGEDVGLRGGRHRRSPAAAANRLTGCRRAGRAWPNRRRSRP